MTKIVVELVAESYPVLVGARLSDLPERLSGLGKGKIFLISDCRVYALFGQNISRLLKKNGWEVIEAVLPAGERTKSFNCLRSLYQAGCDARLERSSVVVALGGGVVTDLAGFFAATYLRGISLVNVPTTLLAQVDASVGGKNGINLKEGKNLVGTFYQPKLVLCDLQVLETLPLREYRCGLAEVIKCGIIKDRPLFNLLADKTEELGKRDPAVLKAAIAASVRIKAEIVREDVLEKKGLRRILNFGHTIGHGLESAGGYRRFNHGEAVAVGMLLEAKIAVESGRLPLKDFQRIRQLIAGLGLPVSASGLDWKKVWAAVNLDKKKKDGKLVFVLPRGIGQTVIVSDIPEKVILSVLTTHLC